MKAGRSLQDLAAELERQHRSKKDFMADTRRLALKPLASGTDNPHEHVMLEGVNGGLALRPVAHTQLASPLGIPKPYYDRMLMAEPDLLCDNVNRWLEKQPPSSGARPICRASCDSPI
jgi:hypothetical protein